MASARRKSSSNELLTQSRQELHLAPVADGENGDGRKFPRFYFRTLATATIHPVPVLGNETQECYVLTRDLSRGGVSFLHPKKLALGQRVDLVFQDGKELIVRVRWIRQLDRRCFLIGCKFVATPD